MKESKVFEAAELRGITERWEGLQPFKRGGTAGGATVLSIIKSQQFSREWIEDSFLPLTEEMEEVVRRGGSAALAGKRVVLFFCEESTRTRVSFELAISFLGGESFTTNLVFSSMYKKEESFEDTIRVFSRYPFDAIVVRSKEERQAEIAATLSRIPVINAGDGQGQHPTQSLADLLPIKKRFGRLDDISVAIAGDLDKGRVAHSLIYLLSKFRNVTMYLVAPHFACIRPDIRKHLLEEERAKNGIRFFESSDIREVAPLVDVFYQTRPQKERDTAGFDSWNGEGFFELNDEVARSMKPGAIIMHPLPRTAEMPLDVDNCEQAVCFKEQLDSGIYTRMALLKMVISR